MRERLKSARPEEMKNVRSGKVSLGDLGELVHQTERIGLL